MITREQVRIVVVAFTGVALSIFVYTALSATVFAPETEVDTPLTQEAQPVSARALTPTVLHIPKLDIETSIEAVGVTARGNMATPSRYSRAGWYKYGTLPGDYGSAVIAGHVDNGIGLSGVFKQLHELAVGDSIYVRDEQGEELRFVVEEKQRYPYTTVPTDRLFERKDAIRLNLVTCTGAWLALEKTYDERLIVFAVLAPS